MDNRADVENCPDEWGRTTGRTGPLLLQIRTEAEKARWKILTPFAFSMQTWSPSPSCTDVFGTLGVRLRSI